MNTDLKHTIYSPSDCLSEKMLFDYIDNKLSQKERHIVEKHLLDCEMCSDALEGLEMVKDRNRITVIKETINKKIIESNEKKAVVVPFNYKLFFSVAATIALLIVGVFYFNKLTLKESAKADMAELVTKETAENSPAPPPPPPPPAEETGSVANQAVSSEGIATGATSETFKSLPIVAVDQEVSSSKPQSPVDGYYKRTDGDEDNKQQPAVSTTIGATTVSDEIALDDRKNNTSENLSTSKNTANGSNKDLELENAKTSEEAPAGANSGTYAWSTVPSPDQNKNKSSNAEEKVVLQKLDVAKKAEKSGKYRSESASKEKDKHDVKKKEARAKEDITLSGNVAYEPKSESQNNSGGKLEEMKTSPTTTNTTTVNTVIEPSVVADSTEAVYTIVEQMPEYPGGDVALMKAAGTQLTYPAKDDASNSFGTVIIEFIVDSSGKAKHPRLVKPKSTALEKQVVEFVNKMPLWKPGKQNNKNVAVKLVLPFKINIK